MLQQEARNEIEVQNDDSERSRTTQMMYRLGEMEPVGAYNVGVPEHTALITQITDWPHNHVAA